MQPCISNSFRIAVPPCKGCSLLLAYGMAGVLPTEGDAYDPGAGIDRHTDTHLAQHIRLLSVIGFNERLQLLCGLRVLALEQHIVLHSFRPAPWQR